MNKLLIVVVIAAVAVMSGCSDAQTQRAIKDNLSNTQGGLNRTVTVFDQNGKELRKYEGLIDIDGSTDGTKVKFDLNGKRHIIYNAIVIADEN